MGTSKGYKMPSGGDWGPLKREATDFVRNVGVKPVAPQSLLGHYIRVRGSSGGSASGTGGEGGSGSASGGTKGGRARAWGAGVATAQRLGGFLSRVGRTGAS